MEEDTLECSDNVVMEHVEDENRQISFLKQRNCDLIHQLRSCEDNNIKIQNELDFLHQQNETLKNKLDKSLANEDSSEYVLRERITFLEDVYANTKVKYKAARKKLKEFQKQFCSDMETQSFCESFDVESIGNYSQKQQQPPSYSEQDESRLQSELDEKCSEITVLKKELLEQQLNFEDINSKLDECQGNVELLRENLLEKESFLVSFKMETNAKIDEAIQYIKLIENEFQLKSVLPGNNDNDDWQVEEKLEQFPSFIKQIYRDFVNLRASNWFSDVETQNIIDEEQQMMIKPSEVFLSKSNISSKEIAQVKSKSNSELNGAEENSQRKTDQNKLEKEDSVNGLFKQRKKGSPGLARTMSQEPGTRKLETQTGPSEIRRGSIISKEVLLKRRSSLSIKKDILSSFKGEDTNNFTCFPSVLLQLQENILDHEDLEKHFAMFSLAMKSDRISLLEREGIFLTRLCNPSQLIY